MRVPRGYRLKYFLTSIKDWFYDWSNNGVYGPGFSYSGTLNWGKISFVLLAIILVGVLIVVI